ncbi:hypothetical protein BG003_004648 [Podila horticola]|nr:hypothetical protein BG003_004648 [Podila horticola]
MSAFRNSLKATRQLTAYVSRQSMLRQATTSTRSLSTLINIQHQSKSNSSFKAQQDSKMGFATSLPYADFMKQDDSLDQAQEYMDEGVSFLNNNMVPLAMSSFQKSLNVRPTAAAHYNMGVGYFQLGDYQSSIKSFQESLKLSPHHADVHTNIATAHIKLNNNLQEALNHLQAAANIAPKDAEIQFNLGVISEQTGHFDGAILAYQAAVDQGMEEASMNLRNVKTKKFAELAKKLENKDN